MSVIKFGQESGELPKNDSEWLWTIIGALKQSRVYTQPEQSIDEWLMWCVRAVEHPEILTPDWNPVQGKPESECK